MQFDFLSQGTYTGTISSPLNFEFGQLRYSYTADQSEYSFPGSYTPSSTFNIGLVPKSATSYAYSQPFPDRLIDYNFDFRREAFDFTFENPNQNNDQVVISNEFYKFAPDFSRGSSSDWSFDFTTQSTAETIAKIDTFSFIQSCEPYVPTNDFKFGWSWYGEPCDVSVIGFESDLVGNTTTPVARLSGDVSPFFIGDLSTQLPTAAAIFNAFTPEAHESQLTTQLPTPIGSFKVYTSTLFEVDLSTTCPQPVADFECFTTEAYDCTLATISPEAVCVVSTRTTDEYIADLSTVTPNAKSEINAYVSPAREGVLSATTGDLVGDFDITFNIPTFIQYLNTTFEISMGDGVQITNKTCILADPISQLTKMTCSTIDLATSLNLELLIPAIEYNWDINRFTVPKETAITLGTKVCGKFSTLSNLTIDVAANQSFTKDVVYHRLCSPAFSLDNYNLLTIEVAAVQTVTDTDFQSYVKRIADGGNPYTPGTTFTIDKFNLSFTIVMPTSNVYAYGVTYHSKILTSGVCSNGKTITSLALHTCSASEEASALPYGRYVPTDPPVEPVDPTPPETGVTISVPIKGLYKVINQYSAKLNDGTNIEFQSLKISCDADSHSWSFSGTLAANQDRSVITPATDGQPIELVVILNSYQWTLLIEGISTTRSFGSTSVSVSGRGVTALLTDPYYSTTSIVQSILQTNQQIAESLVPFDWTIDWALPTWNVPAGTYSHADTTPAVALARHVANCGGMLVPDRTSQKFYAKKRYPVAPWDFGSVTADIIIPDSAIISLVEEPIGQFGYDGVYVHGTTSDGVVALVRKAGTAGSRLVATQSNAMMVDATALHTLGQRVLSGEAPQPTVKRVTTFMDGSVVPLVAIGSLLQVVADGKSTKGIVNSVTVSLTLDNDALKVTQQLGIGESTENTFSLLKALVPTSPLILGKLVSTDGTNSKLDLVNGGTLNARGTGTVGLNYYVMDDVIQSVAPSVTAISDVIV